MSDRSFEPATAARPSRHAEQLRELVTQLAESVLSSGSSPRDLATGAVANGPEGALLYLGNIHDAVPRGLLYDPLLTAVDIVAWQAIRIHAGAQGAARFPRYEDLLAIVRVSKPTLGRAITVLRIVRWLSMMPLTQRNERGQICFQGRVYALHDERIPLVDALHLDPRYRDVVEQHCSHRYPPLANVAQRIRDELQPCISALAASSPDPRLIKRVSEHPFAWVKNLHSSVADESPDNRIAGTTWIKSFPSSPAALGEVKNFTDANKNTGIKNFHCSCSSKKNNYLSITTTTEHITNQSAYAYENSSDVHSDDNFLMASPENSASIAEWPRPLQTFLGNDRTAIARLSVQLAKLPVTLAQAILDEAAGSLIAKMRRGDAIDNPAGYVHALIRRARSGQFIPTAYSEAGCVMRHELRARHAVQPIAHNVSLESGSLGTTLGDSGSLNGNDSQRLFYTTETPASGAIDEII